MQWESWAAFWAMGGKGPFVWWSYAVSFALMALELGLLVQRRRDTLKRLLRWRRAVGKDKQGGGPIGAAVEMER
ncbi:heme exporter protein CcmD [Azoarcus olearius]|uniref:Heme exporter protein D n=1 Tax=Azoarcus sp. (strain BH72) TaxID=418699 RepID=A1KCJ2_AZOSB|nr:heme exporter protein CcmD [Azoarcus olearius]ANQ87092.1 heme exporter protein D [Azoarcus olearius]CAL96548.1 conserved hypothetical heme exporter protein D [Azoarcus olearius]